MPGSKRTGSLSTLILLLATSALFWTTSSRLATYDALRKAGEMEVALPWFVQVLLSGGDRYLAADINAVRALVASTEAMAEGNYEVLAQVQRDAAWLNPAHADNYYIAAAILPWVNQLSAAQDVLERAIEGRPFDSLPPFYYGFNIYYFDKNPTEGARWVQLAAQRETNRQNSFALDNIAARWYERGNEPSVAISYVEAMAERARDPAFKRYLEQRVARLRMLEVLSQASARFEQQQGRTLRSLRELVDSGLVATLPEDPFGFGFALDDHGRPMLLNRAPRTTMK